MKLIKHTVSALSVALATVMLAAPAAADLEVVAVIALQPRLTANTSLLELDSDRQAITQAYADELSQSLDERLKDEFAQAQRADELADEFSKQILDALDERLRSEVGNLIAARD